MKTSTKGNVAFFVGVVLSVSSALYGIMMNPILKLTSLETNILFFYLCGVALIWFGVGVIFASKRDD